MGRDIKFRAWNKTRQEMINNPTEINWVNGIPKPVDTHWDWYKSEWKLLPYTGINDINGIEIYEGDIVEMFHETHTSEVRWNCEYGCWEIEVPFTTHELMWDLLGNHKEQLKIIGNKYQNQELL